MQLQYFISNKNPLFSLISPITFPKTCIRKHVSGVKINKNPGKEHAFPQPKAARNRIPC